MKILLPFLTGIIFFAACNNEKNKNSEETTIAEETATIETVSPQADSTAIRKTITDFYDWYLVNWEKFPTTGLYKGIKKADMPPYQIDWKAVEKYHNFIKESVPQLGNTFIAAQKKFFEQCDEEFKKDTEGEIPYGFDYDWYTNSQEEPKYLVDEMNNSHNWKTVVSGDDATVEVMRWRDDNGQKIEEPIIKFGMKRETGKWTIARIGDPY